MKMPRGYYPMSRLDRSLTYYEVVDIVLDAGCIGVINDLTPHPQVCYDLDELMDVWAFTREAI